MVSASHGLLEQISGSVRGARQLARCKRKSEPNDCAEERASHPLA